MCTRPYIYYHGCGHKHQNGRITFCTRGKPYSRGVAGGGPCSEVQDDVEVREARDQSICKRCLNDLRKRVEVLEYLVRTGKRGA